MVHTRAYFQRNAGKVRPESLNARLSLNGKLTIMNRSLLWRVVRPFSRAEKHDASPNLCTFAFVSFSTSDELPLTDYINLFEHTPCSLD